MEETESLRRKRESLNWNRHSCGDEQSLKGKGMRKREL
jgi:hypothetical protein